MNSSKLLKTGFFSSLAQNYTKSILCSFLVSKERFALFMLSYCTVLQLHTSQAKKGYKISEVTTAEATATQNPGIYNNTNKRYAQ